MHRPFNFFFTQSISPGLTRTEFHGRMFKVEDIEKSKQDYDQRCKDVSAVQQILLWVGGHASMT